MMRAVAYVRFSSELQREESNADQVEVCRRYIERQGWILVGTYEDAAISGASSARPGYQKLCADLGRGIFDVVVVEAIDRLGRRLADVAHFHDGLGVLGLQLQSRANG
jgi:DNA invertase Pin-like site-specific DNA recombinase